MLDWILEKLPVVIFIVVFLSQITRGFLRSRAARSETPPRHDELEADRRTREIQEEIRRKIAQRRAGVETVQPAPVSAERPNPPPVMRRDPTAIPLPEPFGGPLKRMLEELERKVQPVPVPVPPPIVEHRSAELERQQQLADEMRALEETRMLAQRRAAALVATKAREADSEEGQRSASRGRMLDDLRNPESLRRAFVLREVLGTPVGLR